MRGACGCDPEKDCKCFPSDELEIESVCVKCGEVYTKPIVSSKMRCPECEADTFAEVKEESVSDSTYFPILVEILEGGDVGKFKLIKKSENLPLGLSFKIHLCNVSDELFYAFELGRTLTRKQEKF